MKKSQDMKNERYNNNPRSSVFPADSNEAQKTKPTNNNRASRNTGKNSKWKTVDASQFFVNQQKLSSYRVSKDNLIEGKTTKENYVENNKLKTLSNKTKDLTSLEDPSTRSEATKSLDSPLPDQSKQESPNHATTFIEEICNDDAALEEKRRLRRERMKMKKEMKKQEKAILREEEMRKKRLAPKDQKITIIDHSMLDRFLEKESSSHDLEATNATYDRSEFPALGEIKSPSRNSPIRYQKMPPVRRERSSLVSAISEKHVPQESSGRVDSRPTLRDKRDQSAGTRSSSSGAAIVVQEKLNKAQEKPESDDVKLTNDSKNTMKIEDKSGGKRPKRRDPIQLDITEILKVQEAKHDGSVKQHSKPTQKVEVARYAGNILDSDNPERKRGKQREVPKAKKPSTLKQIILQERIKRKEGRIQKVNVSIIKEGNPSETQHSRSDLPAADEVVSTSVDIESKFVDNHENELEVQSVALNTNSSNCKEFNNTKLDIVPLNVESTEDEQEINKETEHSLPVYKLNEVEHNSTTNVNDGNLSPIFITCEEIKSLLTKEKQVKQVSEPRIHSRKFREYCDHFITPEILNAATALLEDIVKFHDRQYARSPLKASAKRRHVTGLKEVRRFMALRKVRLLVIAPDLEHTPSAGGLDDIVTQLKESAITNEVPYVFALNRRPLGYILKKKVPVSCVGVLNYDGTEHNFRNLMSAVEEARKKYQEKVAALSPTVPVPTIENKQEEEVPIVEEDVNKTVVASLLAKLSAPPKAVTPSPFLQAIERHTMNSLDSDSDEELYDEDEIFLM